MERLSAPERTREELRALMNGELGTAAGRSDLVRLALRLIVEEALEGELADVLRRERYERGDGEKAGYRNGYRPGKVKTAEGAVDYSAPQVRDTPEPFISNVRAALSGRTRELERLAVELYARGLSTRDIEAAFTDETGRRLLSRAAVSEITEKLWAEYEDFCKRDLSEHAVAYLFIDGIAERLRPGQRREAVLAAWGIGEDGRKSLLGLTAGSKEDVETVRAFFQDLRARGLGDPLLVVSDGAPGIIRAIEECFPRSARQRCLAHRMASARSRCSSSCSARSSAPLSAGVVCVSPSSNCARSPPSEGPRPRISDFNHAAGTVSPAPRFQQIQALTVATAFAGLIRTWRGW